MYGMGPKLMSQQLGVSYEECQEILKNFYEKFPKIKEFTDNNILSAKSLGYVEDYMGRRRHLSDASLPEILVKAKKTVYTNCDLIPNCSNKDNAIKVADDDTSIKWTNLFYSKYANKGFNAKVEFKELAKENEVDVLDNGAFISKTLTQCTNARIQGSAATLTKKAMVVIRNDEEINKLGFRLLIPVHDELLGECPIENAEKVSKRLAYLMSNAAKPQVDVPFVTDPYVVKRWYADEMLNEIQEYINNAVNKDGKTREEAILDIKAEHEEFSEDILNKLCNGSYNLLTDEV